MIKQIVASLLFGLCVVLAGCSDAATKPASDPPPPDPAVFAITDADGTVKGWLFGTIHALPEGTRWRSAAIGQIAQIADSLVVEVADLENAAALASVFSDLGTTPGLPPLAERVPDAQRQRLAELANAAGLGQARQQRTESWAAALMLAQVSADGDSANGVDRALIRDFTGRPVHELEGARMQLAIFDALPEDAQRALLIAVIEASKPGRNKAERLRSAWLTGDLAVIEAASQQGMMADTRLRKALMIERNRRWLARIEAELQPPTRPLIAVGAAHLVGPQGLIFLLEERGYGVSRLP